MVREKIENLSAPARSTHTNIQTHTHLAELALLGLQCAVTGDEVIGRAFGAGLFAIYVDNGHRNILRVYNMH